MFFCYQCRWVLAAALCGWGMGCWWGTPASAQEVYPAPSISKIGNSAGDLGPTAKSLRSEWEEIASRSPEAKGVQGFNQRLELVDEVLHELNRGFESQRSEALLSLLDDTLDAPGIVVEAAMTDPEITADQLLSRYQLAFAAPLSTDGLRPDDVDILRALYEARLRRASEQIAERGRSVAAANPEEAAKAISFSLVIPLLHHSDHVWSKDEVRQLPVWLRKPDLMAQLEETALRLQRPLAAWSFADFASDHTSGANETSDGTVDYLNKTVDRLLRDSRFDEAVACLQCLLSLSDRGEGRGDPSAVRFRLAEVLCEGFT